MPPNYFHNLHPIGWYACPSQCARLVKDEISSADWKSDPLAQNSKSTFEFELQKSAKVVQTNIPFRNSTLLKTPLCCKVVRFKVARGSNRILYNPSTQSPKTWPLLPASHWALVRSKAAHHHSLELGIQRVTPRTHPVSVSSSWLRSRLNSKRSWMLVALISPPQYHFRVIGESESQEKSLNSSLGLQKLNRWSCEPYNKYLLLLGLGDLGDQELMLRCYAATHTKSQVRFFGARGRWAVPFSHQHPLKNNRWTQSICSFLFPMLFHLVEIYFQAAEGQLLLRHPNFIRAPQP